MERTYELGPNARGHQLLVFVPQYFARNTPERAGIEDEVSDIFAVLELKPGDVVIAAIAQIGRDAHIQVIEPRDVRHDHWRLDPMQSRTVTDLHDIGIRMLERRNLFV